jgi:signal transduction histidine kinase
LSKKALSPIIEIIGATDKIEIQNLKERIPLPKGEHEIHDLVVTMNRLLERIEVAANVNAQFVADASHQLKTPLAVIRGELDLLQSKSRDPIEMKEGVARVSHEVEHLIHLVERLLFLARVDAGSDTLSFQKIELDEVVIEVVSDLKLLAKARDVSLQIRIEPDSQTDFSVQGDRNLLFAGIQNLVDNAIKYSKQNSVVNVIISKSKSNILLKVEDFGVGIPAENKDKIFDRFYREPSKKNDTPGYGIGLAIVKKIADLHAAEIQVQSVVNRGTSVTLEFISHS